MCCLGQFSLQLDKELQINDIKGKQIPRDIPGGEIIPLLTKRSDSMYSSQIKDTVFSENAMAINDDVHTTPEVKISKLRSLLKKYKYKLKVINKK